MSSRSTTSRRKAPPKSSTSTTTASTAVLSNPSLSTTTAPPTFTSTRLQPPQPFTPLSASLTPLTTLPLDASKIYILHLDPHTTSFKRVVFLVPVLLNLAIALLLLGRLYFQLPWYGTMLRTIVEGGTAAQMQTAAAAASAGGEMPGAAPLGWSAGLWLAIRRALTLLLDVSLVRFVAPWPLGFFFERPANPCTWRWKAGVRDYELVVRTSRGWGTEELMGVAPAAAAATAPTLASSRSRGVASSSSSSSSSSSPATARSTATATGPAAAAKPRKRAKDSPYWTTRVAPSITASHVRGKTGYTMMNADWDVDFHLMTLGAELIDRGVLDEDALVAPIVLAWDEGDDGERVAGAGAGAGMGGGEAEGEGRGAWVCYVAGDAQTRPQGKKHGDAKVEVDGVGAASTVGSGPASRATATSPVTSTSTDTSPQTRSSNTTTSTTSTTTSTTQPPSTPSTARQLMHAFEQRLTAMNKEALFYRWIELMQYEASLDEPDGLGNVNGSDPGNVNGSDPGNVNGNGLGARDLPSQRRRTMAMERVRKLFESEGVEYERFVGEVVGEGVEWG